MANDIISIKELSKKSGISYSTLNYYTNIGLLPVAKRNRNTRFYKSKQAHKRLKQITELKDRGHPLGLIKGELAKR